jgi:hypothetical protein
MPPNFKLQYAPFPPDKTMEKVPFYNETALVWFSAPLLYIISIALCSLLHLIFLLINNYSPKARWLSENIRRDEVEVNIPR